MADNHGTIMISAQRLQAVTDALVDGLIVSNGQGIIEAFNPAAAWMFGYQAAAVIGQDFRMLLEEPDRSRQGNFLQSYFTAVEKKLVSPAAEFFGRRRDGSVFPLELRVNQTSAAGAPLFVATIRNGAERREADRLVKAEAARLLAIMNTVVDGLITIDQDGTIETFNRAAVNMFGYQAEEVIGQNIRMLMPEPYCSTHDGYLTSYLRTGAARMIGFGREVEGRCKDGSVFPMDIGMNEMNVIGSRLFVCTVRDITERKKAEDAMRQSIEALSRSNQELDDFAYIASHDLKEPLRGLSNNALYLKEDFEDVIGETGGRRIARITYLCQRMEHLINDLLYFSRLGRQDLAIQSTDLNLMIADIELTLEHSLEEANAKIHVPQRLPTVRCDLPRMTEVFRNLITNAIKYNDKPDKHIEVGSTYRDGRQVYYVRDNGIGIQSQFFTDIFRLFKRLNDEDDKVRGSGVGLTFVKKIIERQGGEIWLDSAVGIGTTFYFFIDKHQEN